MSMDAVLDWGIVIILGLAVGVAELVSRYRDEPLRALITMPGFLYVFLNAGAAALALAMIRAFNWTFGASAEAGSTDAVRWWQVLVAGLGTMGLFRSSLFNVRVGDQDIPVGPSSILQIVLGAADRAVDRLRAEARSAVVSRTMAGVSFAKAYMALPAYCMALMQNLPKEEQVELSRHVEALKNISVDDDVQALLLGLALMNVVGEDVLKDAVKALHDHIKKT